MYIDVYCGLLLCDIHKNMFDHVWVCTICVSVKHRERERHHRHCTASKVHFKHAIRQEVIVREAHDAHGLLKLLLEQVACPGAELDRLYSWQYCTLREPAVAAFRQLFFASSKDPHRFLSQGKPNMHNKHAIPVRSVPLPDGAKRLKRAYNAWARR